MAFWETQFVDESFSWVYSFCIEASRQLREPLLFVQTRHQTPLPLKVTNCCRNLSGRGLVGELVKDYYVYQSLSGLKRLDLSNNKLGYGVAPIPNDLAKLTSVEYLYVPFTLCACQLCAPVPPSPLLSVDKRRLLCLCLGVYLQL
jgi:hypothetical protein